LPFYIKAHKAEWLVPDRIHTLVEWITNESHPNDYNDYDSTKEELINVLAHKKSIQDKQSNLNKIPLLDKLSLWF
jgi:hypothetical protein